MSASALSDSAIKNLLQNYVSQDKRLSAGSIAGKRLSEPEMDGSTSQMTITVSHIPRLQTGEAEEEEGNESAEAAGTDSEMGSVSPRRSESSEFPFGSPAGKRGSAVSFNSGYASPDIPGSRRISLTSVRVPSVVELEEAQRAQEEKAEQERRSLVSRVLNEGEGGLYFGPSLRDVYQRCCEVQGCKPNSYLISKLPTDGRFSSQVEEVDLTASYLGHPGFIAVLRLLDHLPALRRVHFNNMSLDNTDVAAMCDMLASHPTLGEIYLNDNPRITLPSTKHLQRLLAENPRIYVLTLQGTKLGPLVIEKLEREAKEGARQWPQ
ncbi:hypothetical protein, conserved [Angomonas deanei]|uniref:Leucine Rich repeat n=1 Tax=Angomonas deanei TaxID=59799 RepID=A0A7G2CQP3_9TRYP|nr:hypothetical protein, conserved [Angomonas deanei]